MFRLAKIVETGESAFFMLCDRWQCMDARRDAVVYANAEEYRLAKRTFIKTAIDEGWWIDLEGELCPPHAPDMLYAARVAAENGKMVVPAEPGQIRAFGRARL
ncbi:MAG: hypothetical protein WBY44_09625 [Bryobacteraceae bacterium]